MFGKKKGATADPQLEVSGHRSPKVVTPSPIIACEEGGQKKPKGTVRPPLTTIQQQTPPPPNCNENRTLMKPFGGLNTTCAKCGDGNITATWNVAPIKITAPRGDDYLLRECQTCGYTWPEHAADHTPTSEETGT